MAIAIHRSVEIILDKSEKQITWTDVNHDDYRNSWCRYRNSPEGNKENINPIPYQDINPIIEDSVENEDKVEAKPIDEPMEIVRSLNACSITPGADHTQDDDPALKPPPVKRARIVKPPEAYQTEEKSSQKAKPFSFLAREEANRERRDARREYYHLLTQKSSPQPFKARPAPKFKPVVVTPRKNEERIAASVHQSPVIKSTATLPANKYKGSLLRSPKPINLPCSPALDKPPKDASNSNNQAANKTPRRTIPPANFHTSITPTQIRSASASNTPKVQNLPTTAVQTPKQGQEVQRRRSLTIPKLPSLSTAIRAQERKQFQEVMKERERQREALKKMEVATIRAYEEAEIAKLRKSTVHKPSPIRYVKNGQSDSSKRPSTHPLLPTFVKRPRWI